MMGNGKVLRAGLLLTVLFGFCMGMVLGRFILFRNFTEVAILYEALQLRTTQSEGFFGYLCKYRIGQFFMFAACGCVRLGKLLAFGFITWISCAFGIIGYLFVAQLSLSGFVVCLIVLLPQMIFYGAGGYLAVCAIVFHNLGLPEQYGFEKNKKAFLMWISFAAILFFVGIGMEYYVNPMLLKIILKNY